MEQVLRDLRDAIRSLRRRPGFTVTVLLTLALGIGANTAVFSLVNGVLLAPLPYQESERIVAVWFNVQTPAGPNRARHSEATYTVFRDRNETYEGIGLARPVSATFHDGERAHRVQAATVTPPLFGVLGLAPQLGRAMVPEDGMPGAEPVVVLRDGFWGVSFGRDPGVLGSRIEVDGVRRRVIGILPRGARFPESNTQLWIPHVIDPASPVTFTFFYTAYARLKPGVTPDGAWRDAERMIRLLPEAYPEVFRPEVVSQVAAEIVPLRDEVVGDVGSVLWVLFGAAAVVLLIATANVANLFLVRADGRQRELAVRNALGAGRGRIVRHVLTESCVLSLAGAGLGVAFAQGGLTVLGSLGAGTLPRLEEVGIDGTVLAFTTVVAIVVGLLFGVMPALQAGTVSLAASLRSGARNVGLGRAGVRLRSALVMGQVAMATVLLASSGLMLRSFWSLRSVDPGFDAGDVVALRISLPEENYAEWDRVGAFHRQLLAGIRQTPGVKSAASVTFLPLRDGRVFRTWNVEGVTRDPGEIQAAFLSKVVSDGYFETMGIPLLTGRTFEPFDHRRIDDPPAIVSTAYAERTWPNQDPLGRRIQAEEKGSWFTIVGVVGDVRDRSLTDEPEGMVYIPMLERNLGAGMNWRTMSVAIRAAGAQDVVESVRRQLAALDPKLPAFDVRTMTRVVADATAESRFTMVLLASAASAALFLGAVGLYGVLAYLVGQRRNEIGVRMALGATGRSVRRMVARQAMAMAGIGAAVGFAGALAATRLLDALIFGVSPTDPVTYLAVVGVLLAVAWIASSIPAQRAARIDPVVALAGE